MKPGALTAMVLVAATIPGSRLMAAAAPAEGDDASITVLVYNHAEAPAEVVYKAMLEARRIFLKAGVKTGWRTAVEGKPYPGSALSIFILPGHAKEGQRGHVFGSAFMDGEGMQANLSIVYYGAILGVYRVDPSTLLAHVLAHEVGHLLLGSTHTSGTIMAARWTAHEYDLMPLGLIGFNPAQARKFRRLHAPAHL